MSKVLQPGANLFCVTLMRGVVIKFLERFYYRCTCILDSLLRGVTFEVLPLSSYALNPTTLSASVGSIFVTPAVEQFSVPSSHLYLCFQYPEIFVPLRQALFLESKAIQSQIRGIGWVFDFSNRSVRRKQLDSGL
jgi:hypothetical protein